jgi:phage terminase small subunit
MRNDLTIKQRGFVKDYLETGNASQAVKNNYNVANDQTARAMGSENLTKPNIKKSLSCLLDENGLTDEHLVKKLAELVNAKKQTVCVSNGVRKIIKEENDTQAMRFGIEFAFKLKGSRSGEPIEGKPDYLSNPNDPFNRSVAELTREWEEKYKLLLMNRV